MMRATSNLGGFAQTVKGRVSSGVPATFLPWSLHGLCLILHGFPRWCLLITKQVCVVCGVWCFAGFGLFGEFEYGLAVGEGGYVFPSLG
jgi:hypothetical protein